MTEMVPLHQRITALIEALLPAGEMIQPVPVNPSASFADWQALCGPLAQLVQLRGDRVIGINGSQGSGKSTLAGVFVEHLQALGLQAVTVSLDDYYLSGKKRAALAREVHPLLRTRGVPGTHDIARLKKTINHLLEYTDGHQDRTCLLRLPQFDKAIDEPVADIEVRADVIVVEGWCLGVQPQAAAELVDGINALEREEDPDAIWRGWVNQQLTRHYVPVWDEVQFWVHLRVPGFEQVLAWRTQQEQALPAAQRMDTVALQRFIAHYERLTRHLWAEEPAGPGVVIELDGHHNIEAFRCRSVAGP